MWWYSKYIHEFRGMALPSKFLLKVILPLMNFEKQSKLAKQNSWGIYEESPWPLGLPPRFLTKLKYGTVRSYFIACEWSGPRCPSTWGPWPRRPSRGRPRRPGATSGRRRRRRTPTRWRLGRGRTAWRVSTWKTWSWKQNRIKTSFNFETWPTFF